jgi:hypothetical protein
MVEFQKFSVFFSNFLVEVLGAGIARLDLVSLLPLSEQEHAKKDESGACHALFYGETLLSCGEIQGKLNVLKLKEDCRDVTTLLKILYDELKVTQTFESLIEKVESSLEKLIKTKAMVKRFQQKEQRIIASIYKYQSHQMAKTKSNLKRNSKSFKLANRKLKSKRKHVSTTIFCTLALNVSSRSWIVKAKETTTSDSWQLKFIRMN